MDDEVLTGGNTSGAVVRIGDTVRKTWTAASRSVADCVSFVRGRGVDAPAHLGRDPQGRQVLEFIGGELAIDARR